MTELFHGFEELVENSPEAISVIDAQGDIVYGSASNKTLFGYRPDELVGRNCLELVHPEDREHARRALSRALLAPPDPLRWDARVRQKNGDYCWVENTVSSMLLDREVKALVVRQRDIQARRLMEKERLAHAEELTQSNLRLEEFAYTAAHDLREPLRAISLYTEILLRTVKMDAGAQQMAKFVVDGTVQMFALLDDLLCFAQTGMHEPPRRLDLRKAADQIGDCRGRPGAGVSAICTAGERRGARQRAGAGGLQADCRRAGRDDLGGGAGSGARRLFRLHAGGDGKDEATACDGE